MSLDSLFTRPGDAGEPPTPAAKPRRKGLRALGYAAIALVLVALLLGAGAFLVVQQLGSQVGRYPSVFAPIDPESRPADSAGQTFLLVGTDTRSPDATTGTDSGAATPDPVFGSARSDVIMVATIADDGRSASIVSIPRDSWVEVPGRGLNKINSAYAFGGPPLLVQTVEQLTRVRVDHFAVIDFAGFAQMTDAVGGIDVNVGQPSERDGVVVPAGPQRLDGEQALVYVRERMNLPEGDLDRVKRQQNALRAFVRQAINSGTLSSPASAYAFADTVSQHVGVDDTLSDTGIAGLAFGLRDLRESGIEFLTAPTTGTGMEGDQSVVYLDAAAGEQLWFAVNNDQVGQWVETRPESALPSTPR